MRSDPLTSPPRQADLEAAFAQASSITLEGDGSPRRLSRATREALRPLLRLTGAAPLPSWSTPRATLAFARFGQSLGALSVYGDLTVGWSGWSSVAAVSAPCALGAFLAEHGAGAPLAAYDRDHEADVAAQRATWERSAPPGIASTAKPDRAQIAALRARLGGDGAAWALSAWHGARPGSWDPPLSFESISDAALRLFGVHELIAAAAAGVPEAARAGAARFLVDSVTSRGFALGARLPREVREALVAAARASHPDNGARAARLLMDDGPRAPGGSTLVGAASTGSLRRLCTDGARAFAVDGNDLLRLDAGGAAPIAKLFRPETPLAARDGEILFLQPGGVERVRADGSGLRKGRAPLFDLPARRFPGMLAAFAARRDEALSRAAPGADLWPLDPDADACAAYAAFGGDTPAALRLGAAYACDPARGLLIEAPWRRAPREVALHGQPVWMGATTRGVLVVVERGEGRAAVIAVDAGAEPRSLGEIEAPAERVKSALLVGDRAWLCLAAPLGDVVVAVDRAG